MTARNNPPAISYTVLMVCVVVLVCFMAACAVAVFLAAPEGANTFSLIALLIGSVPATVASLVGLVKISGVAEQMTDVQADTNALTNGLGDAKLRAAVADVLHPNLVDPAIKTQLEADKLHRLMPEEHP